MSYNDQFADEKVSKLAKEHSLNRTWLDAYLKEQMILCQKSNGILQNDSGNWCNFVEAVYYCIDSALSTLGEERSRELLEGEPLATIYDRYLCIRNYSTLQWDPICRKDELLNLLKTQVEILEEDMICPHFMYQLVDYTPYPIVA